MAFYHDELGLAPSTHTAPSEPQDGAVFGLGEAQWDAWMMASEGRELPVIDLLQWIVPKPEFRSGQATAGFRRLHIGHPAGPAGQISDPDGTAIEVTDQPGGLIGVTIGCTDLGRSRRFYQEVVDLGDFIRLVEGDGTPPPSANTVGIWRMALATEDIDADVAWLRRAGVPCVSDPVDLAMGPGLSSTRFMLFTDPDGTMLELIQRPRPE
jgi:catechol 2,3-dioxygenase-like lactoylglutathione lyase family enzyme